MNHPRSTLICLVLLLVSAEIDAPEGSCGTDIGHADLRLWDASLLTRKIVPIAFSLRRSHFVTPAPHGVKKNETLKAAG